MKADIAPLRNKRPKERPWEGSCQKKPWEYRVTAAIPVLDTYDTLELVIELLRLQTEPPFIMVIDTGSTPKNAAKIQNRQADDVEVHNIRLNGVLHPSDFPAMAMDLAFTLCRSPFLFATHADCFLTKRNTLEEFIPLAKEHKAVGYEISPRKHSDWKGMLGHTCCLYEMETMDRIGAGWSLRRLCTLFGIEDQRPNPMTPNWPDTELLIAYLMREHGITPHIIGGEENFTRNITEHFDHIRSITSGMLYSPSYYEKAKQWKTDAMKEARARVKAWRGEILRGS